MEVLYQYLPKCTFGGHPKLITELNKFWTYTRPEVHQNWTANQNNPQTMSKWPPVVAKLGQIITKLNDIGPLLFKAALRSSGAFFMSKLSITQYISSWHFSSPVIGRRGQNKGTLRSCVLLSRVYHPQVCPCTSERHM